MRITTRYGTAANGGGRIVAHGAGRQATIHYPHELNVYFAHLRAAETLAGKLGLVVTTGEATDRGYTWDTDPIPRTWQQAEPWDADKAQEQRRTAVRLFADHGHDGYWDRLTRENCGACALQGYDADHDGPNYASWERTYVQAGYYVRPEWAGAFVRTLTTPDQNEAYRVALMRDLATYGVPPGLTL